MAVAKKGGKKVVTRKRRDRKNVERGVAHIQSTFNNTCSFMGKGSWPWI